MRGRLRIGGEALLIGIVLTSTFLRAFGEFEDDLGFHRHLQEGNVL